MFRVRKEGSPLLSCFLHTPLSQPLEVTLGDNSIQLAKAYGDAVIDLPNGSKTTLPKVYFVPGLKKNLISISELTSDGLRVEFTSTGCYILAKDPQGKLLTLHVAKQGRLYPLGISTTAHALATSLKASEKDNTHKSHQRLGHVSSQVLHQLINRQLVVGLPKQLGTISTCEGCIMGKSHQVAFPRSSS